MIILNVSNLITMSFGDYAGLFGPVLVEVVKSTKKFSKNPQILIKALFVEALLP